MRSDIIVRRDGARWFVRGGGDVVLGHGALLVMLPTSTMLMVPMVPRAMYHVAYIRVTLLQHCLL